MELRCIECGSPLKATAEGSNSLVLHKSACSKNAHSSFVFKSDCAPTEDQFEAAIRDMDKAEADWNAAKRRVFVLGQAAKSKASA
jgi:hypothetical protein